MSKLFVYIVNGETFEDTVAFGKAWEQAKATATREHTSIKRDVVYNDGFIRNEFYSTAGYFLSDKFSSEDYKYKAKIF